MDRLGEIAMPDKDLEKWIGEFEKICMSLEVRELVERLEKEDDVFPQTVIQIEED